MRRPTRTHVELQIRRVPGGAGTGYVHEQLKLGDTLSFNGPNGRFLVRKSRGGPLLFLAGGTGVSSPRSMILDLLEEGYAEPITLVHGVRAQADLYGREEFEALARSPSRISVMSRRSRRSRRRAIGRASAASSMTSPSASMAACSPATPPICAGRRR